MDLVCFPLLGTNSRRAIQRRYQRKSGWRRRRYRYKPRKELVFNLAYELKTSEEAVRAMLKRERLWLLRDIWGAENITEEDV